MIVAFYLFVVSHPVSDVPGVVDDVVVGEAGALGVPSGALAEVEGQYNQ